MYGVYMIHNTKFTFRVFIFLVIGIIIGSGTASVIVSGEMLFNDGTDAAAKSTSRGNFDSTNSRGLGIDGYSPRTDIDDSNVMYAIIAPDIFVDELIPLADWKTYKGVPTIIYKLNGSNSILNKYSGRDDAEKLHGFLRVLDDTSPALTWLLLAGDAGIVPIRELYVDPNAGIYNIEDAYYSDYYYSGLDHNWDFDNNGVYGEGTYENPPVECDWTPDVYVGRIPVEDEADTTIVVNKILTYEKSPPPGNWLKSAVLWGGLMDAPNDMSTSDGDPKYEPEEDNAYEVKELKVLPLLPSQMSVTKRYDYAQLQGGNYYKTNDNLYRANAISDFNKGNSIVNFAGQAYYCGAALLDYTDPDGMAHIGESSAYDKLYWWDDARDSANGNKLPLVFLSTCGAGDFAEGEKPGDEVTWKDKTMEKLITSTTGGAIGLIGSTGATYRGEDSMGKSDGNWWLDAKFWELFFNGEYQQGKAFFKMKTEYVKEILLKFVWQQPPYKAELFGYNLQGDPEVAIWTDTPKTPTVLPSGVWVGTHNVTVKVLGIADEPVENARVCLQNSEIYAYGVTNATGVAEITVSAASTGTLDLVVTAHNFQYYEDTLDITIEPADLTLTENDVQFSNDNPEEGEQITIDATIHNQGQTDFTPPVTIRITDGNPNKGGVKISDEILNENIVIGAQKTVQTQWTVTGGGNHTIYVQIDPEGSVVESYKNNNLAYKKLIVRQTDLSITGEDLTLDPTGKIPSTSNVNVSAKVHNLGDAAASNVIVSFYEIDANDIEEQIGTDKTIPSINKDQYGITSINYKPKQNAKFIIVHVDLDNYISESDEENNNASINININSPPTFSQIPDLAIDEDSISLNAIDLELYISDADDTIYDLAINLQNTNSSYCSVELTLENTLNIMPVANWSGLSVVKVDVDDGFDTTQTFFNVTINPVNDRPRLTDLGTIELNESEEFNFTVTAFDIDSESLTFSDNTELFEIDPVTGLISFTPSAADIGDHYITIKVSDNHPQSPKSDDDILTLKILNIPNPPILNKIGTQYATAGVVFSYTAIAIDPDSELLLFSDDTHLFDIERRSGIITFLPEEEDVGKSFEISITVNDGLLNDTETFTLYINSSDDTIEDPPNGSTTEDGSEVVPLTLLLLLIIIIVAVVATAFLYRKRSDHKDWDEFRQPEDRLESQHDDEGEGEYPLESPPAGPDLPPTTLSEYDRPRSTPKRKVIKKKIKRRD